MSKCKKIKYKSKNEAIKFLQYLKKKGYNKNPYRNEVAYYQCEKCNHYHTCSNMSRENYTLLKDFNYIDFQKKRMSHFLLNDSKKKGRL